MQGTPNMEEIMSQIKGHLLPTIDHGANGNIHHYNRVWEKIEKWASASSKQKEKSIGNFSCECGWLHLEVYPGFQCRCGRIFKG